MSLGLALNQPHEFDQWTGWFKEEFAPADLDETGVHAFIRHFADLGIFEPIDENRWILCGVDCDQPRDRIRDAVRDHLETLGGSEAGFAVAYFLGRKPVLAKTSSPSHPPAWVSKAGESPDREKASDLSNLQIVKKVGRQLQPFLEFEKQVVSRLRGTHTQPQDARIIFNFILRQTRRRAEPKKWEQLSRKRHR